MHTGRSENMQVAEKNGALTCDCLPGGRAIAPLIGARLVFLMAAPRA